MGDPRRTDDHSGDGSAGRLRSRRGAAADIRLVEFGGKIMENNFES